MANGLLLQYVNKRKNDYKHFMGVSSLPSFELISKHISLSDANASGWGAWATHRFDFQSQSHSIEVWEDLWKPQLAWRLCHISRIDASARYGESRKWG